MSDDPTTEGEAPDTDATQVDEPPVADDEDVPAADEDRNP